MATRNPPAAGTNQGAAPRPVRLAFHPKRAISGEEDDLLFNVLGDFMTAGLYSLLCTHAVFETGEVLTSIAHLQAVGTPPRPQQGRPRKPPSYEQVRRMLRDLESVGLIVRDRAQNALQGQLRMRLPYRAAAYADWKKQQRAQQKSQQGKAQGHKARKPA